MREQYCASGSQRTARPPEMQRGWMTMANRLLACGSDIDRVQRKRNLDQLLWNLTDDILFRFLNGLFRTRQQIL